MTEPTRIRIYLVAEYDVWPESGIDQGNIFDVLADAIPGVIPKQDDASVEGACLHQLRQAGTRV